jgi:predicted Zn-dependent peptidase
MGANNDKKLDLAVKYLKYLGTSVFKPSEIQQEFYKLGCSFGVYSGEDQIWVYLSGLSENMERGLVLFENLLADAQPNKEALKNLASDVLKQREDDKLSNDVILWSAMYNYGEYGPKSPFTNILTQKELEQMKADELVQLIKGLNSFEHQVFYYGPDSKEVVASVLNKYHNVPEKLKPVPAETKFEQQDNNETKIYVVDYEMKQVEILMLSKSEKFNKNNAPIRRLFNEYFGGGMSSIVFQELRESKALAYSAFAGYRAPSKPDESHYIMSYIGTQNDKLPEAMKGMFDLLNNMPESEKSLNSAKVAILKQIRTERITKSDILFGYLNSEKMGIDHDIRIDIYNKVPGMNMSDLKDFQSKLIKNRKYCILVLGKKDKLDITTLQKYGKIEYLDLKTIFGY